MTVGTRIPTMTHQNGLNCCFGKRCIPMLIFFIGIAYNLYNYYDFWIDQVDSSFGSRFEKDDIGSGIESTLLKGLLPKKVYTITGLESSGTNFVASIISNALDTGGYREAGMKGRGARKSKQGEQEGYITVQHMSLPTVSSTYRQLTTEAIYV